MAIVTIRRGDVPPGEEAHFLQFVCPPTFGGGPLDPQAPTLEVRRDLDVQIDLPLPPEVAARTGAGRDTIRLWIIEDPDDSAGGRTFPSKLIRTREGDVVHAPVGAALNTHTIHWHGIEPSSMNDGVGHTSFEISGNFVYQFATSQAGTYFYHCHKNTVLHFEMGLYGLLIVDPAQGEGFVAANLSGVPGFPGYDAADFVVPYDVEALWVPDEFDSRWHELGHDAFMQDCRPDDPAGQATFTRDGILHDFRPDVFVITGVVSVPTTAPGVRPEVGATITDPGVAVSARAGDTVLIRLLNAGYTVQEYTLGLDAWAIASDGHPFGVPPRNAYSSPFLLPSGTPFRLTTARRVDLLVRATTAGTFPFAVKYIDWVNNTLYHEARTVITVSP